MHFCDWTVKLIHVIHVIYSAHVHRRAIWLLYVLFDDSSDADEWYDVDYCSRRGDGNRDDAGRGDGRDVRCGGQGFAPDWKSFG